VIASVDVGTTNPSDVAFTPDGSRAYVANPNGTIAVIAISPGEV